MLINAVPIDKQPCPNCGKKLIPEYYGIEHDGMIHPSFLKGYSCGCGYKEEIKYDPIISYQNS